MHELHTMFNKTSTNCFVANRMDGNTIEMHGKSRTPSLMRLLECAAQKGIHGPSELARELGESEQTVTNWGARGVSKVGALKAERKFGCGAAWVLTGEAQPLELSASKRDKSSLQRPMTPVVRQMAEWLDEIQDAGIKDEALRSCVKIVLDAKSKEQLKPTAGTNRVDSPEKHSA